MPLEDTHTEMGHRQDFFNQKALFFEPATDGARMEIKIQRGKLNRFEHIGVPGLMVQRITDNGFNIALIGIFQNEGGPGPENFAHLVQGGRSICHMVQGADHRGRIEKAVYEWQTVDKRGNIDETIRSVQLFLCLLELGAGLIRQDDALKTMVTGRIVARTCAQFEH